MICLLLEYLFPKKQRTQSRKVRWLNNLGIVGLNSMVLALIMPMLAFEFSLLIQHKQFGLIHNLLTPITSPWYQGIVILSCIVLLDAIIYIQHVITHRLPILWRFHRMHHSDQDIDVTTGSRFHPVEIIFSMFIKLFVIAFFGIPPIAILIFEIILNGSAMFNHSNLSLSSNVDKRLRRWVVTPDMHRIHHSIHANETHSNFGFFLSIWDRLFHTYIATPKEGHQNMVIGIPLFQHAREQWLDKMLTQPFRKKEKSGKNNE
ncbi:sterol desaturase family protein [Vibrio sp.]|nr:sterol desaturase family protein [Vibrio sp.]